MLPLIDQWIEDKNKQFLILCPSKELAYQIKDELVTWKETFGFHYALITGGMKDRSIKNLSEKKPDFIIANPGMLKFLHQKKRFQFKDLSAIVLDEVDQMIEKSMEREMNYLFEVTPSNIQKMFFSATVPKALKEKIESLASNIEWIEIQKHISNKLNITEKVYYTDENDKEELIFHVMYENLTEKTLIFFNNNTVISIM